jgi:hypothetical protein
MAKRQLAFAFASQMTEVDLQPLRSAEDLDIGHLDATFRDSTRAPMHSWFPYLEGYSPRFVERIRHEFLPTARRVIEPFAGTGTTPIVLGHAGIECAFAEANPAMAFVINTKLASLGLAPNRRQAVALRLLSISRGLPNLLRNITGDKQLRAAYHSAFGKSVFFNELALEEVLRLRTLNDSLRAEDENVAACFSLAVLASLIPSSLLERAGDLRYKTDKELARGLPSPCHSVQMRLATQAGDLVHLPALKAKALFAAETAAVLDTVLDSDWDGVITSPPYLNGTNYIRNTRLELWYLRLLHDKNDLRRLRDRVVTSGINDVDAQTRWAPITAGIESVVKELQEKAYDSRIAKMVGGYFNDMSDVLRSLQSRIRGGARICIDIGDSVYAGVHVRTDDLLVELAEDLGFRTVERVHLRRRYSKRGVPVREYGFRCELKHIA